MVVGIMRCVMKSVVVQMLMMLFGGAVENAGF